MAAHGTVTWHCDARRCNEEEMFSLCGSLSPAHRPVVRAGSTPLTEFLLLPVDRNVEARYGYSVRARKYDEMLTIIRGNDEKEANPGSPVLFCFT